MFFRRCLHRLRERRLRRQRERELSALGEAGSVMAYLDDQIAKIDVSITVIHTEMMGMVYVRDTLIVRRDRLDETMHQAQAMYRSA